MPHCFLSYARVDADIYFEQFVTDFLGELRGVVGAATVDGLVFRDSDSIALGATWEPKLEQALQTCRTFLALLSPTYLQRPACNKEWAHFDWRLRATGGDDPPGLLLPLMWIPVPDGDLPPAVKARQFKHSSLSTQYAERGLRSLVQRNRTEYRDFLTALANLVRDLARQSPLPVPPAPPVLDQLSDPFRLATPAPAASAPVPAIGGPKSVEFIVVAARQTELAAIRRVVASYGADVTDWCPYRPANDTSAGLLVQEVALGEKFMTLGLRPIHHHVIDDLRGARARNTIVVIVIDVWSLRLPAYRAIVSLIDSAERFLNAGVLVVWNFDDDETPACEQALVNALRIAFPTLMIAKDPHAFHDQLRTPVELIEKLRATLHVLKRRTTEFGEVMRMAEGAAPIAKPQLVGPGAAQAGAAQAGAASQAGAAAGATG